MHGGGFYHLSYTTRDQAIAIGACLQPNGINRVGSITISKLNTLSTIHTDIAFTNEATQILNYNRCIAPGLWTIKKNTKNIRLACVCLWSLSEVLKLKSLQTKPLLHGGRRSKESESGVLNKNNLYTIFWTTKSLSRCSSYQLSRSLDEQRRGGL